MSSNEARGRALSAIQDMYLLPPAGNDDFEEALIAAWEMAIEHAAQIAERVASFYSSNNGDNKETALLVAQEIRADGEG